MIMINCLVETKVRPNILYQSSLKPRKQPPRRMASNVINYEGENRMTPKILI
jgi:hypothetical protein